LSDIEVEARKNNIKFETTPLAVYHWRKHNSGQFGHLSPTQYLVEANRTVDRGHYIPKSNFKFIRKINTRSYHFVSVANSTPIKLVTYHIKNVP
jgi:hypothetical protein